MSTREFRVRDPHMKGADVSDFQRRLNAQFEQWGWNHRTVVDGDYGAATRADAALVLHGLGYDRGRAGNVTAEVRRLIRTRKRNAKQHARWAKRLGWRRRQKKRFAVNVAAPLNKITADSWGYHPGVHDGIDLICPAESPIFAMVKSTVVRADTGGWWGKAPSGDVSKGDGIIVLRVLENVGPFRKGMNLCYGHAEHPVVRVGQTVNAGQVIGRAGLAVAWHIHLMVNDNADVRGVGDRDPRPFYEFAVKNGK